MTNIDRAAALPKFGYADTSPDKPEGSAEKNFKEIVKIFIRTWPFLLPLIIGYWREKTLSKAATFDPSKDKDWSFHHAPFLVTIFTLIGPLTGLLPMGVDFKLDLLLGATVLMAVVSWALIFLESRLQVVVSVALVVIGVSANLAAIFLVEGYADNFQVGLVSFGCLCIWLVQYRIEAGGLEIRVCPMTTPAWTQLFAHATGLVTDIGGILGHGSIVAREYGIPAVANIPGATKIIKDGQKIKVDGNKGKVSV